MTSDNVDPELNRRSIARGADLGLIEVFNDGSWTLTGEYSDFLDSIPQQLERPDLADVKESVHRMPNSMTVLTYFTMAYLKESGFMRFDSDFDYEFAQLMHILDHFLWGPRSKKTNSN